MPMRTNSYFDGTFIQIFLPFDALASDDAVARIDQYLAINDSLILTHIRRFTREVTTRTYGTLTTLVNSPHSYASK